MKGFEMDYVWDDFDDLVKTSNFKFLTRLALKVESCETKLVVLNDLLKVVELF